MFGADLRTPFHHQRGGQPLLKEPPKRRLGPITASRGVELPVGVVLVPPGAGEPLAEPGAANLPAELSLDPSAGVAGAARYRPLDLHVRLERARDTGSELHAGIQENRSSDAQFALLASGLSLWKTEGVRG